MNNINIQWILKIVFIFCHCSVIISVSKWICLVQNIEFYHMLYCFFVLWFKFFNFYFFWFYCFISVLYYIAIRSHSCSFCMLARCESLEGRKRNKKSHFLRVGLHAPRKVNSSGGHSLTFPPVKETPLRMTKHS